MVEPSFKKLTADHMHSCHNRDKFWQQVGTQSSSKGKTFPEVFIAFLKSA